MPESKEGFTVKDRRQFTSAGERKAAVEDAPAATAESHAQAPPESHFQAPLESPAFEAGDLEVDFTSFLVSLAAQAGALLAPPEGEADLVGARQLIGILDMLKQKTQGRRTSEEDRVLEGLLYQLRMAYLEASRRGGA